MHRCFASISPASRVPPPDDADRFVSFARLGHDLLVAHLLEDESITGDSVAYPVGGDNGVEKGYPKYVPPGAPGSAPGKVPVKAGRTRLGSHETLGRVYINPAQHFEAVEPAVWQFQIDGYQVCEKWLKDRRGRTLDFYVLTHYMKIVEALRRTTELMNQIEAAGDGSSA